MLAEILGFLTAGAFVYVALKIKFVFGNPIYYALVGLCLAVGIYLTYFKGA